MALQVRRVITGHDANGKAIVKIDEVSKNVASGRPGATACNIWTTEGFPANNDGAADEGLRKVGTTLKNGTIFRIIEFAPGLAARNHRTDSIDYIVIISGEIDMELDGSSVHLKAGDVMVQRGTIHNWINRGAAPCVLAVVLVDAKSLEADGQTHAERYAEMFDLIELAEELGFDVAWLAELHFGGAFSLLANPLMLVPVIAQRTKWIRLGTAVTLLPLQHPLSCAEQAATADVLSGGRLEFGVGRGSIPSQFHGFRVPVSENRARFDEALEIIRLAWTRERFSYRGEFYQVEDLAVVPRPVQQPHPPIRVAVHTAESFAHIGDLGLPIYSGTTTTPLPQLREYMTTYREHLAAAGHSWTSDQMALMLPVHVGATGPAAREAMRPGVHKYYKNLQTIFSQLPASYTD